MKKEKIQKSFLLSTDNVRYLARIKYLKGIKYTDLINGLLDYCRKHNIESEVK